MTKNANPAEVFKRTDIPVINSGQSGETDAGLKNMMELCMLITENASDMISLTDVDGIFAYANPAHRQCGYEPAELIGKPGMDFIHMEDVPNLLLLFDEYLQMNKPTGSSRDTCKPTFRLKLRFKDKSGNYRLLDTTVDFIVHHPEAEPYVLFISREVKE